MSKSTLSNAINAAPTGLAIALSTVSLPSLTGCSGDSQHRVATAAPLSPVAALPPDLAKYVLLDHPALNEQSRFEGFPVFATNNLTVLEADRTIDCENGCKFPLVITADGVGVELSIRSLTGDDLRYTVATLDTGGLFELSQTGKIDVSEVWIPEGSTPVLVSTPLGTLPEFKGLVRSIELQGEQGSFICSPMAISIIPSDRNDPLLLGLIPLSSFDGVMFDWNQQQMISVSVDQISAIASQSNWESIDWNLVVSKSSSSHGTEDLIRGSGKAFKRIPTIEVKSGQNQYEAVLDTGSTIPLVVHDRDLIGKVDGRARATGHHDGSSVVQYGPLKEAITFGPVTIPAGTMTVYIPPTSEKEKKAVTIGLPVLREQNLILDFQNGKVHFQISESGSSLAATS